MIWVNLYGAKLLEHIKNYTMIYRYIYKITCTKGRFKGKFYFGQHTTKNLNDGYKGSGSLLMDYYKKYPNDYIKEILGYYNSQTELNAAEYNVIKDYLGKDNCLNLKGGGDRGELTDEYKKRISNKLKGNKRTLESIEKQSKTSKGHSVSNKTREKISLRLKGKSKTEEHKQHLHKHHRVINRKPPNETTRNNISNTIKAKGYKWMNNSIIAKQIPLVDQQHYIELGWEYGRAV